MGDLIGGGEGLWPSQVYGSEVGYVAHVFVIMLSFISFTPSIQKLIFIYVQVPATDRITKTCIAYKTHNE